MIRGSEDGTGSRRPLLGDAGIVTPPDSQGKGRCRNAAVFLRGKGQALLRTTSQSASQTAPLVGEPLAKPFTLRGLPKPPLGRGGGSASALTERLSSAAAYGQALLRTTSQSASQTAPLVGEPLAKPFTLRGLPKPPLGRGGGSASALTERLSSAAAYGQALLRTTSQSASQTAPLVGEPLAKRRGFTKCQSLPSVGEVARRQP